MAAKATSKLNAYDASSCNNAYACAAMQLDTGCLVTSIYGGWTSNAFMLGPTATALVVPPAEASDRGAQQAAIDVAATMLDSLGGVHNYYSGSWLALSKAALSGQVELLRPLLRGLRTSPPPTPFGPSPSPPPAPPPSSPSQPPAWPYPSPPPLAPPPEPFELVPPIPDACTPVTDSVQGGSTAYCADWRAATVGGTDASCEGADAFTRLSLTYSCCCEIGLVHTPALAGPGVSSSSPRYVSLGRRPSQDVMSVRTGAFRRSLAAQSTYRRSLAASSPVDEASYFCFRIPSLLRLPNGNLALFAEGRQNSCSSHRARTRTYAVPRIPARLGLGALPRSRGWTVCVLAGAPTRAP